MTYPNKTIEQLEKSEAECCRLEKEKMALELQLQDAIEILLRSERVNLEIGRNGQGHSYKRSSQAV